MTNTPPEEFSSREEVERFVHSCGFIPRDLPDPDLQRGSKQAWSRKAVCQWMGRSGVRHRMATNVFHHPES